MPTNALECTDTPRLFQTTDERLLRKIDKLARREMSRRWGGWTALQTEEYAADLGVGRTTVSMAMKRMEAAGLIERAYTRRGRSPRLLVRLTDAGRGALTVNDGERLSLTVNDGDCRCISTNLPSDLDTSEPVGSPGSPKRKPSKMSREVRKKSLTGPLPEKIETPPTPPSPKTPTEIAHWWSDRLHAFWGERFMVDPKTVRHVKLVQARFERDGFDVVRDLQHVFDHWQSFAPKEAGKVPYPWAVLRAADGFVFCMNSLAEYQSRTQAAPAPAPKPEPTRPSAPDVLPKHMTISERIKAGMKK